MTAREKPERIADELRSMIVTGELHDGESLGRESDLVERFGVSRPSLREALRILEAEGLILVVRGVRGGVVVRQPDERFTARNAALVLQYRNTTLADVHEARSIIEPAAARMLASARDRRAAADELRGLIDAQRDVIDDPVAFGKANAEFHERLVALAGNQTLEIVAEMLNEIVERAVTAVSQSPPAKSSLAVRRRGIRSQERLVELVALGAGSEAESHWRAHMEAVGKVILGQRAKRVVDLFDHY
ncbi:MAG TPA: GntR family transcriptional regulator [Acidimicrobiia bacterium]|nr:GntR family transcriptional regulator [Acidimicrobiia bacterium]